MSVVRAVLLLALALLLQAGAGRLLPEVQRFADLLLVPVAIHGVIASQRATMAVGCASGLLSDTWFQAGPFGLNGFKRTFLGWALGAAGNRLDLNQPAGRFAAGAVVAIGDDVLDFVLRGLLEEHPHFPGPLEVLVKALVTGLLVALCGGMLERRRRPVRARRMV